MSAPAVQPEAPVRLPFEPLTLLVGLSQRARLLVLLVGAAALAGFGLSRLAGRTYEAETLLLYTPPLNDEINGVQVPRLESRKHMVKIAEHLEQVRHQLGLSESTFEIGRRCEVKVQKDTQLLSIRMTWSDAERAAQITNRLRDVFLASQRTLLRGGLQVQVDELERQAESARRMVDAALQRQRDFRERWKLPDIDQETRFLLEELSGFEQQLAQARIDDTRTESQSRRMPGVIATLSQSVAVEQKDQQNAEGLRDVNVRAERLRDAIRDDKDRRTTTVQLKNLEIERDRFQRSFQEKLVSEADYRKVVAECERVRAMAVDPPHVTTWKEQLKELDRTLIPTAPQTTPSTNLLNDLRLRSLNLDLELSSSGAKVRTLEAAVQRIHDRLALFPSLQKEQAQLAGELHRRELALDALQAPLNTARQARDSLPDHFKVVNEATAPEVPLSSKRALVLVAATLLLSLAFATPVVLREAFCREIRSARELAHWLETPAYRLEAAPDHQSKAEHGLVQAQVRLGQTYGLVRRWIGDRSASEHGIFIAALDGGPEDLALADEIAAQLVMQGLTVGAVHLDAPVGAPAAGGPAVARGVIEFLQGRRPALDETLEAAPGTGVLQIELGGASQAPHLLGGERMEELLRELRRRCDVLVIRSTAKRPGPDLVRFALNCSRILLVARAGVTRRADVVAFKQALGGRATVLEGLVEGVTGWFRWLD